jgi:hypothetical protein
MTRSRRWVWYFLALLVLTAAAIVTPIVYNLNQLLTPEQLAQARARWEANGPDDYDLVLVERRDGEEQGVEYRALVRGGQLQELREDDVPLALSGLRAQTRARFTVPGLFDQIAGYLERDADAGHREVFATAYFEKKLGYPLRYVRRVRGTRERLEYVISLRPALK